MIIEINSRTSGWSEYVTNGTSLKPRDKSKIEILDGDFGIGDELSKNNGYYTIVLGFKGKVDDNILKEAYEDFKEQFFVGYQDGELHTDSIIHKDTSNDHIHIRIPKQNLLTGNQIQLYYDKIDRKRKELVQDYISLKYGFEIARETNRPVVSTSTNSHINKWRDDFNQTLFEFDRKKGRTDAQNQINDYMVDLIKSGIINDRDDIEQTLEDLDLTIEKFGSDLKKDFSYVTVSNDTGKVRIKGEIYGSKFWEYSKEDRNSQINNNSRDFSNGKSNASRLAEVQEQLQRANEARRSKLEKLFEAARNRAKKEHEQLYQKYKQKCKPSLIFNQWRYDCNFNYDWHNYWTDGITINSTEEISGTKLLQTKSSLDNTNEFKSSGQQHQSKVHQAKQQNNPYRGQELYDIKGELEDDSIRATINELTKNREKRETRRDGYFSKITKYCNKSAAADFTSITKRYKSRKFNSCIGRFNKYFNEKFSNFIRQVKSRFTGRAEELTLTKASENNLALL